MKKSAMAFVAAQLLLLGSMPACAQSSSNPSATSPAAAPTPAQMQEQMKQIAAALAQTRQQIEQSQQQMLQLERQMQLLQQQMTAAGMAVPAAPAQPETAAAAPTTPARSSTDEINEHLAILDAEVKQHDQTKVESASKYPVHVTGLLLFNSFVNNGTVDDIDLPEIATHPAAGVSNGSTGASFRQTILGLRGTGPVIFGAHTSAEVSMDFFGGVAYSNYGTSAGTVRLRTARIALDWQNNTLAVGFVGPLISPLSPSSYATVAEPSLAWAGNLWTWAPQTSIEHRIPLENGNHIGLEFGLWDPPTAGYSTSELFRATSPGELSRQPAYETRISYAAKDADHGMQFGLGGYYSRQSYPNFKSNDAWAITGDWRLPLAEHFEFSGEGYRGRSLGGLGGGVYKDILVGTPDPSTGIAPIRGLNAVGGWGQLKWKPLQTIEANIAMGQDAGFASDFRALPPPTNASAVQLRARNQMVVGNLIYRPKTYLIFSPEYRRIWTWPITGPGVTADIFTLSIGYQF